MKEGQKRIYVANDGTEFPFTATGMINALEHERDLLRLAFVSIDNFQHEHDAIRSFVSILERPKTFSVDKIDACIALLLKQREITLLEGN